jgi:hypothetical protein
MIGFTGSAFRRVQVKHFRITYRTWFLPANGQNFNLIAARVVVGPACKCDSCSSLMISCVFR